MGEAEEHPEEQGMHEEQGDGEQDSWKRKDILGRMMGDRAAREHD